MYNINIINNNYNKYNYNKKIIVKISNKSIVIKVINIIINRLIKILIIIKI